MGLRRQDLRAFGAELAVRRAALEGRAQNPGQQKVVRLAALRHERPEVERGYEHDTLVNGGVDELCARIAELSNADREHITKAVINMHHRA